MFKLLLFPVLLTVAVVAAPPVPPKSTHWEGTVSNGMKGDKISFDVSADGKTLSNVTFQGYWRCSGKLEQMTAGPTKTFSIVGGKASGVVVDPPGGGSTAWHYEFEGTVAKTAAKGTYRMAINNLGCDTYKLQWTAVPATAAK
ncbi:hypothetical protein F0P96_14095 [Hymenobacter busanensis]|uniref:Uncharacterized protein n=1 Tax=Hymenobacter busanensis TaxID=2607656 RepID=A0A7L5A0B9_9BACT|nr:hypothetical protein [Hymenobacter busanensis]KAA9331373.1 hypothetical protein F0P96_14095 [Hymenobacter busanensis]QHJ08526.1 hypothetical protein GUY19_15020 [Hymenobacter busanensis]